MNNDLLLFHNGIQTGHGTPNDGATGPDPMGFRIIGNRIRDLVGCGGGASGSESKAQADRAEGSGDGITVWGNSATVIGNVVNARLGTDARVGIHAEALTELHTSSPTVPHPDAMVTMSGNVVYGPFRRGLVTENVSQVAISGNVVADSTWWAVNVAGSVSNATVVGNTVKWTRKASDNHGSTWAPKRGPLAITGPVEQATVTGNTVTCAPDSAASHLFSTGLLNGSPKNIVVSGNVLQAAATATVQIGIRLGQNLTPGGGQQVTCENNIIEGVTQFGIWAYGLVGGNIGANRAVFTSNTSVTVAGSTGIALEGGSKDVIVHANYVTGFEKGVDVANCVAANVQTNSVYAARWGVEMYGSSQCIASNNHLVRCTNGLTNADTSKNQVSGNFSVPA